MKRLVVLADTHGNLPALEAVLADVEAQGAPDAYWILGDLAAFCPWPAETIARLRELPNASFVQGNTDRYLVTGRRPWVPVRSEADWAGVVDRLAQRDANFRWTVERLAYSDYGFLTDLPERIETDVVGFGRVVAVHANSRDDETFVDPDADAGEVRSFFSGLDASLALYGHTHLPVDRTVDGMRIVNPGSVGLPIPLIRGRPSGGDPRAGYAVLEFLHGACAVELRRIEYETEEVVAELERVKHPAREWVARRLQSASS